MERRSVLIYGILIACLTIGVSCSSDDDNTESHGSFAYNGIEYSIKGGYIVNYGQTGESSAYSLGLVVYSDNCYEDASNGTPTLAGTGVAIYINLYALGEEGISPGTYVFDPLSTKNAGTFYTGYIIDNPDSETHVYTNFEDGGIVVANSEGSYEIEFNLIDLAGTSTTGSYLGTLETYSMISL